MISTVRLGGYLETMYGGAGAEVFYRPVDSKWAFGLNANDVKQRDWRSAQDMMTFTDYSVKTGHLTAYWTPSFAKDRAGESQRRAVSAGTKAARWTSRSTLTAVSSWGRMPQLPTCRRMSTGKGNSPKGCM
ncbi:YjbH domain-containing protein [Escherichia coli]